MAALKSLYEEPRFLLSLPGSERYSHYWNVTDWCFIKYL